MLLFVNKNFVQKLWTEFGHKQSNNIKVKFFRKKEFKCRLGYLATKIGMDTAKVVEKYYDSKSISFSTVLGALSDAIVQPERTSSSTVGK